MNGNSTFPRLFPRLSPATTRASSSRCLHTTIISTPIKLSLPIACCRKLFFGSRFGSSIFLRRQMPLYSSKSSSNIVLLNSTEELDNSLNDAIDQKLPAIFYFTAAWCGPCKLMSPIITELSKKYPTVTVHKIDVDQEALQSTLSRLAINSVPMLYFFLNGKKAAHIVGANGQLLRETMDKLYGNKAGSNGVSAKG